MQQLLPRPTASLPFAPQKITMRRANAKMHCHSMRLSQRTKKRLVDSKQTRRVKEDTELRKKTAVIFYHLDPCRLTASQDHRKHIQRMRPLPLLSPSVTRQHAHAKSPTLFLSVIPPLILEILSAAPLSRIIPAQNKAKKSTADERQ